MEKRGKGPGRHQTVIKHLSGEQVTILLFYYSMKIDLLFFPEHKKTNRIYYYSFSKKLIVFIFTAMTLISFYMKYEIFSKSYFKIYMGKIFMIYK